MENILASLGLVTEHHSAYEVRPGMLNGAVAFFLSIKWREHLDLAVSGPWGQARFVSATSAGSHVYQLTELSDGDPEVLEMTENHIGIHVTGASPQKAAETILEWAVYACAGEGASIEAANPAGTKWFVYLPALFRFAIEIV